MKRPESDYPVGSKWTAKIERGISGIVWLDRIMDGTEVWRYSYSYGDGSGGESDWDTSKRKCVEACASGMRFLYGGRHAPTIRFKRVKEVENV
jgi:hypothetical protein